MGVRNIWGWSKLLSLCLFVTLMACQKFSSNKNSEKKAQENLYPFPIGEGKFNGLPLKADGKIWAVPNPEVGQVIKKYFEEFNTNQFYDCKQVSADGYVIKVYEANSIAFQADYILISKIKTFDSYCENSESIISIVTSAYNIEKAPQLVGSSFELSSVLKDVYISLYNNIELENYNRNARYGKTDWFLMTRDRNERRLTAFDGVSVINKCCGEVWTIPGSKNSYKVQKSGEGGVIVTSLGTVMKLPKKRTNPLDIVGGSEIDIGSSVLAKSTVAIFLNGLQICTGSLIGSRYVVTAAHCVSGLEKDFKPPFTFSVGFGSKPKDLKRSVQKVMTPPNYKSAEDSQTKNSPTSNDPLEPQYDIAIMTLKEAAPHGFQPIAILPPTEPLTKGEVVRLAGYGKTEEGASGLLKATEAPFEKIFENFFIFSTQADATEGTCNGDSGGPAFVERKGWIYLLGATSYSSLGFNCQLGYGYYTDIRKFVKWMTENSE